MKALARLVAVLGAVAVGWVLFGEGPKDVELVYELPSAPGPTSLEIRIRRGEETVRRAELRLPPGDGRRTQVRHRVRLPAGSYELAWRRHDPGAGEAAHGTRPLAVREDGTVVLALTP